MPHYQSLSLKIWFFHHCCIALTALSAEVEISFLQWLRMWLSSFSQVSEIVQVLSLCWYTLEINSFISQQLWTKLITFTVWCYYHYIDLEVIWTLVMMMIRLFTAVTQTIHSIMFLFLALWLLRVASIPLISLLKSIYFHSVSSIINSLLQPIEGVSHSVSE